MSPATTPASAACPGLSVYILQITGYSGGARGDRRAATRFFFFFRTPKSNPHTVCTFFFLLCPSCMLQLLRPFLVLFCRSSSFQVRIKKCSVREFSAPISISHNPVTPSFSLFTRCTFFAGQSCAASHFTLRFSGIILSRSSLFRTGNRDSFRLTHFITSRLPRPPPPLPPLSRVPGDEARPPRPVVLAGLNF